VERREGHALDIAIVAGSAAGLFAGLLLARAGHQALVLERDFLQPAPDVESAAAAAFRPTAPQIVQPHIVMARCRQLLIERLPDVYAALLAAGVAEAPLRTQMPDSLSDTEGRPGDELLTPMMTRRSTIAWVLQRAAAAEPRVTVRWGVKVTGLLTAPDRSGGRPPHVTGVRTDCGDLAADLVVDAKLRVAASYNPVAFRAFWKINGMICPPDGVYTDPDVVSRTQETLRRHGTAPPVAQPTREQLLTALTR
jgi:2-polyprenyl-6-methoxyphenol hydroxylase-like FAD-dependent oxidoreductase